MNRKTFVSITLFLYTLLLIFEYPGLFYPGMHQGTDSWGNVAVSNSINDKGHDIRFRHVLSFFGLSPYSNSMGAAFFLSAFSLISDIPVINSIYVITSLFFVSMAFFGMFLLAKIILKDDLQAIICAFILMTTRVYLAHTRWEYSYRAPYFCFLIVFFLLIFRQIRVNHGSKPKLKEYSLILAILLALSSIHQMFYFNSLIFLSLLVFFVSKYFSKHSSPDSSIRLFLSDIRFKMGFSSFMFLFCFLGYSFYERNTLSDSVSELNVNYLYGLLKYLSLKYATRFGFLLVFAPLGAYYIIKDTSNTNYFLYVILTSYSLVFYDTSYPLLTLMPFLSIITVKGLFSVFTQINFKQSTIHFSIIALVVFSAISPEFFVFNTKEPPVPGIEHSKTEEQILARNVAFYIEKEAKYPMVHNLVGGSYILAFTEIPMHRSDLYIPTYSSEDRWVARDIMKVLTAEEGFDTFLEDVGPASFSLQHGVLLLGEDKDNEKIKLEIRRLTNYNATSFIVATYAPIPTMVKAENGEFVESVFLRSVHEESYTIYLADYHRFYFLNYDE